MLGLEGGAGSGGAIALFAALAVAALLLALLARALGRRRPIAAGLALATLFFLASLGLDRLLPAGMAADDSVRVVLPRIAATLTAFAVAFAVDAALRRFVWFGALAEGGHSKVPQILIGVVSVAVYAVTAMLVASIVFHRDVTAIAATSGVLAIVIGYSAQSTLAQLFSGIAMNIARPFKVGDSVQIDGVWGVVQEATWRDVLLRTYEGTLVLIPNAKVASDKIINLDLPTHDMRHHIPFTVDLDVPPARVQAVGVAAMRGCLHVLETPPPMVLFKNFTPQGVAYEAIFWHHDPNWYIVRRDEVGAALWCAFQRAGIALSADRLLQARAAGQTAPTPPTDEGAWRADARRKLRALPLFGAFPDAAIAGLAAQSRRLLYAPGERIMRVGEEGTSLYIVLEGQASVRLDEGGAEREAYAVGPGGTVGHMSAMTGAPRRATVRALSHLALLEVCRDELAPLLAAHPAAIEAVAKEIMMLETREAELRAAAADGGAGAEDAHGDDLIHRLADRIRGFFAGH